MGKSTINGPFSMAMLNNQRVPSGNQTWQWKSMEHLETHGDDPWKIIKLNAGFSSLPRLLTP